AITCANDQISAVLGDRRQKLQSTIEGTHRACVGVGYGLARAATRAFRRGSVHGRRIFFRIKRRCASLAKQNFPVNFYIQDMKNSN
ncbi:MAG: hypothetical protein OXN81_05310, partial [Alphaproteobacteria bacterium]|nr:hypothetical protein [Alphaproteobacteria bacterium]